MGRSNDINNYMYWLAVQTLENSDARIVSTNWTILMSMCNFKATKFKNHCYL